MKLMTNLLLPSQGRAELMVVVLNYFGSINSRTIGTEFEVKQAVGGHRSDQTTFYDGGVEYSAPERGRS